MIDRFMCSDKCPCPAIDAATKAKYNALLVKRTTQRDKTDPTARSLYVEATTGQTPVNNW